MNAEESAEPTTESLEEGRAADAPRRRGWRRFAVVLVVVMVMGVGLICAAYWNNNQSRMSDAAFAEALAQAVEKGREWVREHPDKLWGRKRNASMFYLLQDMNRLRPTPVFARMVNEFMEEPGFPTFWRRLLDPQRHVSVREMNQAIKCTKLDYRWVIYALKPDKVKLDPADEEGLFDGERWNGLVLAHQLWALCHLRRLSEDPRATDELVTRLCQRIAREHANDILVHKLHCERTGFILMAGHPEMINRRWVERIIESQREDGGWNDPWYALTVVPLWRNDPVSDEHSTLVALWALYQVKYAFPETFGFPAHQ